MFKPSSLMEGVCMFEFNIDGKEKFIDKKEIEAKRIINICSEDFWSKSNKLKDLNSITLEEIDLAIDLMKTKEIEDMVLFEMVIKNIESTSRIIIQEEDIYV